jgi:hypothetical protein
VSTIRKALVKNLSDTFLDFQKIIIPESTIRQLGTIILIEDTKTPGGFYLDQNEYRWDEKFFDLDADLSRIVATINPMSQFSDGRTPLSGNRLKLFCFSDSSDWYYYELNDIKYAFHISDFRDVLSLGATSLPNHTIKEPDTIPISICNELLLF